MRDLRRIWNKGFSLVELVIGIAILSIVGIAITSFVVVAQRNYNTSSTEADLQYEAQLLANQLQDLIIDTERGISYAYNENILYPPEGDADSFKGLIIDDSEITDSDKVNTKQLYVYNNKSFYVIEWNNVEDSDEKGTVYYTENVYDAATKSITQTFGPEVLAEYVTGFGVDLSDVAKNNTVTLLFTLEKRGRSYTTTHKVKLRNEVLPNRTPDELYDDDPIEITADRIVVQPAEIRLWPGENNLDTDPVQTISAKVTSYSGYLPSQNVSWARCDFEPSTSESGNSIVKQEDGKVKVTVASDTVTAPDEFKAYAYQGTLYSYNPADPSNPDLQSYTRVGVRKLTSIGLKTFVDGVASIEAVPSVKIGQDDIVIRVANFAGNAYISDLEQLSETDNALVAPTKMADFLKTFGGVKFRRVVEGADAVVGLPAAGTELSDGKIKLKVKDDFTLPDDTTEYLVTVEFESLRFPGILGNASIKIVKKQIEPPITQSDWLRGGLLHIDTTVFDEADCVMSTGVPKVPMFSIYFDFYYVDPDTGEEIHTARSLAHNQACFGNCSRNELCTALAPGSNAVTGFDDYFLDIRLNTVDPNNSSSRMDMSFSGLMYDQYGKMSVYGQAPPDRFYSFNKVKVSIFRFNESYNQNNFPSEEPMWASDFLDIPAVALQWKEAVSQGWSDKTDGYYTFLGTSSDSASSVPGQYVVKKFYYAFADGWDAGDASYQFIDNGISDYQNWDNYGSRATSISKMYLNKKYRSSAVDVSDRFGCYMQNASGGWSEYYYNDGWSWDHVSTSDDGYALKTNRLTDQISVFDFADQHCIYVVIPNWLVYYNQGRTLKMVYEGNPYAGHPWASDVYSRMDGCSGSLNITFKSNNVDLSYSVGSGRWAYTDYFDAPCSLYCPTPEEFSSLGLNPSGNYYSMYYVDYSRRHDVYYLNENRYHIRSSYNSGSYVYNITAQTPTDGYDWTDSVNDLWKFYGNIYYRFYDNGTGKWDGDFIKK